MLQKIKKYITEHKIISIITLIIILVGLYFIFRSKNTSEIRYVTALVQKGDMVSTVTGTGQVESLNTITLSPKASGDITSVSVNVGDKVSAGTLIATVDTRDAKIALESAKISLAKLQTTDNLTLAQKQNLLSEAKDTQVKSYDNGWNTVASYLIDMKTVNSGLENLYGSYLSSQNTNTVGSDGINKINAAEKSYYAAKSDFDSLTSLYKTLSRSSDQKDIDDLINKAYLNSKELAGAVKNTQTAFDYTVDLRGDSTNNKIISFQNNLSTWSTNVNGYVDSTLSSENLITSSNNGVTESQQSLNDLVVGTTSSDLDIQAAQLNVESKQNSYNDCFIRAPLSGVVASLTATIGGSAGSSIGTLITKQKIALITLNEVDVASVKLGQKVALTFDAIDGLNINGNVVEIDPVGTVSSGVVSYNVKIGFDTQDDRVKPGMSVSSSIITNSKKGVLVVPNSAIKTKGKMTYVETFETPLVDSSNSQGVTSVVLPIQKKVTVGLVNDTVTEITSGLNEKDQIVIRTIAGTTTSSTSKTSTTPSASTNNRSATQRMLGGSAGGIMGGH